MKPVIEVKGVSKQYIINHKNKASYNTLKDDVASFFTGRFSKELSRNDREEKFWALKDVNFEIPQGEIFGIIGHNGSGKSTMLKILSRIIQPTEGEIKIRGRVASLLEVGTGFHPELTGRENIYFNGSMLGMSRQEIGRKFKEIVDFSEVEKFIDTPVKFYSSGMYVRLAFSVAAHLDPEILILDEVLAVGDASFQQKSLKKILSTMQEGRTVVFVSHSTSAVRQLCTNGVMLKNGHVAAAGNVGEIIDQYMVTTMNNEQEVAPLAPTWENEKIAKSDQFDMQRVCIVDEDGHETNGVVRCDQQYFVKISGVIKTPDELFNVGYAVWDESSKNLIYIAMSTDAEKRQWPKHHQGQVDYYGSIPVQFFNEGRYKITAVASVYSKFWIFDPEASPARIGVEFKSGLSLSPQWLEARGGLTAPHTQWKVEK